MPTVFPTSLFDMDRTDPRPEPVFTREELRYLQALLDSERAGWFNWKMELIEAGRAPGEAEEKYQLAKGLRNKVYHLDGRDTLALGDVAEQRHWDQGHDY